MRESPASTSLKPITDRQQTRAPLRSGEHDDDVFFAVVEEVCRRQGPGQAGWDVQRLLEPERGWIRLHFARGATPGQGWKLHISANLTSAEHVLRCALAVLLSEPLTLKIAGSPRMLAALNRGQYGLTQVGKFITVYPDTDQQAVRVAVALDRTMHGLPGPKVPTDRPLTRGSLVHYRYGGFREHLFQTPVGEVVGAILTPGGDLAADRRVPEYCPPEWAEDPFLRASVAAELPPPLRCGSHYYLVGRFHRTARGEVDLALDLTAQRCCVLKRANHQAEVGGDGYEARDRLCHEADVLRRLGPDCRVPTVYELFEETGDTYLAMEDIDGETLERYVTREASYGRLMPPDQVVTWGRLLARSLATIHRRGLVHRDLQARNVIVTPKGELRLVDFEMAHDLATATPPIGFGTRGYMSPQQAAREPPGVTDDIYSLGALLYYMATAAEPSLAPKPFALLDRPLGLMNPAVSPELARVIARCLDPNPTTRFGCSEAVDAALARVEGRAAAIPPPFGAEGPSPRDANAPARYRELARRVAEAICQWARPAPDGHGRAWASNHQAARGWAHRGLNVGSAGTVLALAELVAEFGDAHHQTLLQEGAHWLLRVPRLAGPPVPGLYVGEAGIGAALLRAGQVLGDREFIAAAAERAAWIATLPHGSPDVFNGTAGRLRFHLLLWDETGESAHLRAAIEAGEALLENAAACGDGEVQWLCPPGHRTMNEVALVGYAHGAAGIADTLLDLFEVSGDRRYLAAVLGAGRWLSRLALPALRDGSGLEWPYAEEGTPSGGVWCHGAAGVGQFLAHAARLGVMPDAAKLAARAACTVARGSRWASPVQCHGLAGHIEFLLDLYQTTRDRTTLAEVWSLARVLEAFAVEQNGWLVWPSDDPDTFSPDYTHGFAGVGVCLLRLADPERAPRQLTRRGFRHRLKDNA